MARERWARYGPRYLVLGMALWLFRHAAVSGEREAVQSSKKASPAGLGASFPLVSMCTLGPCRIRSTEQAKYDQPAGDLLYTAHKSHSAHIHDDARAFRLPEVACEPYTYK